MIGPPRNLFTPAYRAASAQRRRAIAPEQGIVSLRPARYWDEAFLVGNGTMQGLVFGDPLDETIAMRHEGMLVSRWERPPMPPRLAPVLKEVRRLLLAGRYDEANALAIQAAIADGYPPSIDETGFGIPTAERHHGVVIRIRSRAEGVVGDVARVLDLSTGEVSVHWTDERGAWVRKLFVSRPQNLLVLVVEPPPGATVEAEIELRAALDPAQERPTEPGRWPMPDRLSFDTEARGQSLTAVGRYEPTVPGSAGYAVALRIASPGAELVQDGSSLGVTSARSLVVLGRVVSLSQVHDASAEPAADAIAQFDHDYPALLARHEAVHGALFSRARLRLDDDGSATSGEELQQAQLRSHGFAPALLEKLFDLGRYYLLAVTGRWPSIAGHININVNLQISAGTLCGLPEVMEPYFRWIEGLQDDFRENAKRIFGFGGVLAATHPDEAGGLLYHFARRWPLHYWISGAGWSLAPFWEHYQCTGDEEFARKRILPLLKEVAVFYEDYLTELDDEGHYVFVPSFSPENRPSNASEISAVAFNATMDVTVCREVLGHLVELCERFAREEERLPVWRAMIARLPPLQVDEDGALKEWCSPRLEEHPNHRHVSHLYGAWPGGEITPEETPELAAAARLANRRRGQEDGSAHGLMHRALVAARLRDTSLCERLLKQVLEEGYLIPANLMTRHYPFRMPFPDACGSIPTLIVEMLISSRPGVVEILPALPSSLGRGAISGVALRTNARAEHLRWDLPMRRVSLRISSGIEQRIVLVHKNGIRAVATGQGEAAFCQRLGGDRFSISLPARRALAVELEL